VGVALDLLQAERRLGLERLATSLVRLGFDADDVADASGLDRDVLAS
jgi:hypothetical protein